MKHRAVIITKRPELYKCSECGGYFSGGHYCMGKSRESVEYVLKYDTIESVEDKGAVRETTNVS